MRVVKIVHNENKRGKRYLFETDRPIFDGDILLVSTGYGEEVGYALGDSFMVDSKDLVALEECAEYRLPLEKVLGRFTLFEEKLDNDKDGDCKLSRDSSDSEQTSHAHVK